MHVKINNTELYKLKSENPLPFTKSHSSENYHLRMYISCIYFYNKKVNVNMNGGSHLEIS
jgi:hypothetical protein